MTSNKLPSFVTFLTTNLAGGGGGGGSAGAVGGSGGGGGKALEGKVGPDVAVKVISWEEIPWFDDPFHAEARERNEEDKRVSFAHAVAVRSPSLPAIVDDHPYAPYAPSPEQAQLYRRLLGRLADAIPADFFTEGLASPKLPVQEKVFRYNDSRTDVAEVRAWFERALIGLKEDQGPLPTP